MAYQPNGVRILTAADIRAGYPLDGRTLRVLGSTWTTRFEDFLELGDVAFRVVVGVDGPCHHNWIVYLERDRLRDGTADTRVDEILQRIERWLATEPAAGSKGYV